MTYSTIPLDGAFENPTSYTASRNRQQFNDGGVFFNTRDGQNNVRHTRSVSMMLTSFSKKAEIESFLKARCTGIPFYFVPFVDKTEETALYTCQQWSFQNKGGGVYAFQADFEQVFRF